ncbi:MAG: phytoene desaturase family protein [Balneolaceae bacterium]
MMKQKSPAAIIGCGLGGLATACRLAFLGHPVTLFEKNDGPGGKMQEIRKDGYRFDTGPSLLTMADVLNELFESCGEKPGDYLTLLEPEPLCRYLYPDGTRFDNFRNPGLSVAEIQRFAPEDADAYRQFLEYCQRLYIRTSGAFLFNPLYQLRDLADLRLTDMCRIDAFRTVSSRIDREFHSPYLRQFFKRFTTYNGSSPFQAPATLNVIPHVELNQGGFYVKGGLFRIAESLYRLAGKLGVKFRFQTGVQKIRTSGNRVTGLLLENGTTFDSKLVISNSDATETLTSLLGTPAVSTGKIQRLKRAEPSSSGFVLLLGTDRNWDLLRHHTIFFSTDYRREFADIFQRGILPHDPTIYIANTSHTDPSDAPEGGSNLFILVNAPWVREGQDWNEIRESYTDKILNMLDLKGLSGIRESIRFRQVITPVDFRRRFLSHRGSIYGRSSNSRLAAFLRPRNKVAEINGLYLTGGGSHPGGGIPLVLLSARHAVELIRRHEQ